MILGRSLLYSYVLTVRLMTFGVKLLAGFPGIALCLSAWVYEGNGMAPPARAGNAHEGRPVVPTAQVSENCTKREQKRMAFVKRINGNPSGRPPGARSKRYLKTKPSQLAANMGSLPNREAR